MLLCSIRLCFVVLSSAAAVASPPADPLPHPTRPDRLVVTIDGFEIEYSPEHDGYARPLAEALAQWRQREIAQQPPDMDAPLSPQDMRDRRDEILLEVARAIGLEQPTPLQGPCYDTFLNYYEMVLAVRQSLTIVQEHLAASRRFALWDRSELTRRLARGESVEGFTYNSATDELNYNFYIQTNGTDDPASPEEQALKKVAADGLDHGFNYTIKDGVADFSATVKIQLGKLAKSPAPVQVNRTAERVREQLTHANLVLPVKLGDERGEPLAPAQVAERHIRFLQGFADATRGRPLRDGLLVLMVLHETAEVGLVEHYIGSADRRWLCDGTANFVAWQVARDRAGSEFAREVYDVEGQLARVARWQPKIRLNRWRAVERQPEKDRRSELDGAHYAFATRAVSLMAKEHGEDMVSRLWREIGRTPRAKASLRTADRAFHRLTGARLRELVRDAEKLPLPAPPPRPPVTRS